jgi:predicted GNAT family acetyltransferase
MSQLTAGAVINETFMELPYSMNGSSLAVEKLSDRHTNEVLSFLAARPQHTVFMMGLIHDNGLVSPLNRGTFYGCRNEEGALEGVALIGHATLLETNSDAALEVFAKLAQNNPAAHMILGEQEKIEQFWHHYSTGGTAPRLVCRELLFEQRWPVAVMEEHPDLRLATIDDLDTVVPVHAAMAFEESGVNPLDVDPEGFRRRCARRIEQGRVWVLIEDGALIFKTDVVSDTPDAIYLEGVYVAPHVRGEGYGVRCISQLSRTLLSRTTSIVLLANEQNAAAAALYQRAGFKLQGTYDTIFLQRPN